MTCCGRPSQRGLQPVGEWVMDGISGAVRFDPRSGFTVHQTFSYGMNAALQAPGPAGPELFGRMFVVRASARRRMGRGRDFRSSSLRPVLRLFRPSGILIRHECRTTSTRSRRPRAFRTDLFVVRASARGRMGRGRDFRNSSLRPALRLHRPSDILIRHECRTTSTRSRRPRAFRTDVRSAGFSPMPLRIQNN